MKKWVSSLLRNQVGQAKQFGQPLTFLKLEKGLKGDGVEGRKTARGLWLFSR